MQTDFADDLPRVSVDRVQLQQVILNLLLNAADAMEGVEDRPRALLVKTGLHVDGSVELAVRDSGRGVDPHAVGKTVRSLLHDQGQGHGHWPVDQPLIIEGHDRTSLGRVQRGPGATFSFCIPCASLTAHSRAPAPALDSPGAPSS